MSIILHSDGLLGKMTGTVYGGQVLDTMNSALVCGHRIEIRGFGSLTIIHRAPRLGCNPRSCAAVDIPQRRAPHFKVGKALRDAVDSPTKNVAQGQPK